MPDHRRTAHAFLDPLDERQRALACHDFASPERLRWQYTPGPRAGLALAQMAESQREAAMALLRTALSDRGLATARAIMALEPVLREIEREAGRPGWQRRDAEHYWFAVFGDPDDPVWGWRVGGHHLCVHVTLVGDRAGLLPLFFGANPATAPDGSRLLAEEEDAGRTFVLGLDPDQRAVAVRSEHAPSDILTGNAERAEIAAVPTGIRYADLDSAQRRKLDELVGLYTGRPAAAPPVDMTGASFAWLGSTAPGRGHYYAVRADPLLIELENTQNGANHVHTVVRDLHRDWGEDLLAAHYVRAHE